MLQAHTDDIAEELGESTSAEPVEEIKNETDGESRAPESEVKAPTDSPEPSADGRLRGPDGKFLPKTQDNAPVEATPTEVPKEKSKYEKSQERLAEGWKNLDATKAEVRRLADELRQWKQQQAQQPPQQNGNTPRFDAKQYQRAAGEFKDKANQLLQDGDIEGARQQFNLSDQCNAEAQREAQRDFQSQQEQFNQQWQNDGHAFIREVPELQPGSSDLAREHEAFIAANPVFLSIKDGFRQSYEVLTWKKSHAEVSGLREQGVKDKAEIARLNQLLTPSGGKDPAKHSSKSTSADEPLPVMRARLEKEAEAMDYAA